MKRILAISTLAVAASFGFASVAGAQTANSIVTGTVDATCSVTATNGTLTATANATVGNVSFPTALTSSGGSFSTLCNTASSAITITNALTSYPSPQLAPSFTYDLTGSPTVYPDAGFIANGITVASVHSGTAVHNYSNVASTLGVVVKVAAQPSKILQNGTYTVNLLATLVP